MKEVVVERGLDVVGRPGRQLGQAHPGQVGADPLIVPQALRPQTVEPQSQSQEGDDKWKYG
jgi:hypothetical protein